MVTKKLLFLMLLCIGLVSCSSDDDDKPKTDSPITNLEIPQSSSDNPIKAGESVTIKGEGFNQSSEIWLKTITKSTDVKAEVTSVTISGISFTVPNVSGERNIVLKQSGQEYTLGKMYFDDSSEIIVKKRIVKTVFEDEVKEFSYNEEDRLQTIKEYSKQNTEITFKYNTEGLLIEIVESDLDTQEIDFKTTINYINKTTLMVTEKDNNRPSQEASSTTVNLNEVGRILSQKYGDQLMEYEYDSNDNVSRLISSYGETYVFKYDDRKSYLSNMGLPLWYWSFVYQNLYKYLQHCYDGPNNILESTSENNIPITYIFKYDYDDNGYPTVIYDANENNKKIGEFTYEVIK